MSARTLALAALAISAGHAALGWYWPRVKARRRERAGVARFWRQHGLDATTAPALAARINSPFIARLPAEPIVDRAGRALALLLGSRRSARAGRPAS